MPKVPNPGDKCPRCKSGLVVKTEVDLECDECSWQMGLADAAKAERQVQVTRGGGFKASTFKIRIDDPHEAENFLKGLIVARSNNSSEYFVDMIDAVNLILQPYRAAKLKEEMSERAAAGMG
jgi:hypothetical protein